MRHSKTHETPGGKTESVTFRATIPVKAAAIDIHGETGARLTLEIADSDMGDFLPVVLLRCKRLRVTVEIAEDGA